MKLRLLPAFVTLLACAVTSISLFIFKWDFLTFLIILLAVLIVFYVLGTAAMMLIRDISEKEKAKADAEAREKERLEQEQQEQQEDKEIPQEGEVIDKSDEIQ